MPIKAVLAAIGAAILIAIGVAVVLLTRGDTIDLSDDPRGQEACDALVQAQRYEGDAEIAMGSLLSAAKAALVARTPEIRDTATELDGLDGFGTVDADKLQAVCEDAGIEFPE